KHLHVLPAVVVLFLDLEWNDPQWPERQVHCANLLQELRNNLQDRNTRIALVLLQKNTPQEDLLASERAASLTNACGITNKMMFILPHNDHLMGYILRLESAFLEMAQTYYATMSKTIRSHREQLATPSHVTLRIRHQFKLGFVAEMRSDFSTALKHYSQAYATLDDIKITDQNCLEIKTVAGFLNYKICRLMFKLNIPRDSINQFMTHIEKYKEQIGYKDLIFEHYAWLSMQNSTFADLFCEAIKNGLPALQTQHPGIYYHKGSEYIVKRRNAFRVCCSLSPEIGPTTVPISTAFSTITTAQEMERAFNHSAVIIHLLGLAMNQYKQYRCMRFKKKITIEMAKEYHASGDHSKALTYRSIPDICEDT
uniref:Trafficking protein particle complex subunit 11 domain-containing protein n=1 Tax=Megaselia scalaris TaxID=36166 RepID=T1GN92_MEGSC